MSKTHGKTVGHFFDQHVHSFGWSAGGPVATLGSSEDNQRLFSEGVQVLSLAYFGHYVDRSKIDLMNLLNNQNMSKIPKLANACHSWCQQNATNIANLSK